MVIPPVTCRIAALGLRGFFLPKAVLYYWKCQSFFSFWFLIRAGLLSKEKIYILVNSLALIATISLPISTALDQNASTKRTKASISFMPLLSFFLLLLFSPPEVAERRCSHPEGWVGLCCFQGARGHALQGAERRHSCAGMQEQMQSHEMAPQQLGDTALGWRWEEQSLCLSLIALVRH